MKYYRGVRRQKGKGIFSILLPLIASAVAGATQAGKGKKRTKRLRKKYKKQRKP